MAITASRFRAPPRNMVQEIRNIVEGYKMGPLRALAQDPVQNSYDAYRQGIVGPVRIEYHLHEQRLDSGDTMFLLTVQDRNTTGLLGPALSTEDLQRRAEETSYLQLHPDENWAAWEAMGYTKIGEDALGSRGQGKASFLYHSRHPTEIHGPDRRPLERMIILYDSLLEDGLYRLGVRLARPDDNILFPPYEGERAKRVVQTAWTDWEGPPIPLLLEPLSEVGTRIVVPFLSNEAVEAFQSGEMAQWLERCWWRAIQEGRLEITVRLGSGQPVTVGVPAWWRNEPWNLSPLSDNIYFAGDIRLEPGSPLKIKRIVLLHDSSLPSDEVPDIPVQYSGIQLLRQKQWIETLGAAEKFGDFIPRDKRPGFRGFVEFDRRLDRELRSQELPQHDTFLRHRLFVRQIDTHIKDAVHEFAESQGWLGAAAPPVQEDRVAQEILGTVVDTFLPESVTGRRTRRRPAVIWTCDLDLDFPRDDSARVEWGETLRNIVATCRHDPADQRRDVRVTLSIVGPNGEQTEVASRSRVTSDGHAEVKFDDITIVRVSHRRGEVACWESGRYQLRIQCVSEGRVVTSTNRNIYVRTDPPPRITRDYAVDISVHNASTDRVRINHGEAINIAVTVTNRTSNAATLTVNGSLGPLLLANSVQVVLPGRPQGDAPSSRMMRYMGIRIFTSPPQQPQTGLSIVLEPGRHSVVADVYDVNGEVVAHATKAVFIETDPERGEAGLPFEVKPREEEGGHYPIWELDPPAGERTCWLLWYAREHPTYQAAVAADRSRPEGSWLYGRRHFWVETYCGALVEWALILYRNEGNQGGFKLFTERVEGVDDPLWENYQMKVEDLMQSYLDPLKCLTLQREVVSLMMYLIRRGPR